MLADIHDVDFVAMYKVLGKRDEGGKDEIARLPGQRQQLRAERRGSGQHQYPEQERRDAPDEGVASCRSGRREYHLAGTSGCGEEYGGQTVEDGVQGCSEL